MVARSRSSRRRKAGSVRVDLSDVESRVLVSEGEHQVKVVEITEEEGQAAPYLKWVFEVISDGDDQGGKLYHNTSLAPQALWNLRSVLEALGTDIPDSAFDLEFSEYVDLEMMVEVGHEKYEGRPQPRIVNMWAVEEEEEPPKKGKARRAKDEEEEEETKPVRRGSRRREEPEEEEEEPEETARRSSKKPAKKSSKKKGVSQDEINDMSQEELEDLIEEHDLEVDLAKLKTLRKMRQAVVDAAEEAKVLED